MEERTSGPNLARHKNKSLIKSTTSTFDIYIVILKLHINGFLLHKTYSTKKMMAKPVTEKVKGVHILGLR